MDGRTDDLLQQYRAMHIVYRGVKTGAIFQLHDVEQYRYSVACLMVNVSNSQSRFRCHIFRHVFLSPSSIIWHWPKGSDALRLQARVIAGQAESNGSLVPDL